MMRKTNCFIAISIILFTACSSEQSTLSHIENTIEENGLFSYKMQFDADHPHYVGDNITRSTTSGEWEDGDVIYLFLSGDNEAYAYATYDKGGNSWMLHSDKMLEPCNIAQCTVWYGKGAGQKTVSETSITYDYLTEAYYTESGQYSFQNGEIRVTAKLLPFGRRLRFKGKSGSKFLAQGKGMLTPYSTIATFGGTGFGLSDNKNWNLQIKSDGYSDYIVFLADVSTVKLILIDPNSLYTYSRYFDQKTLKEGESGCFTVPTTDNHVGWSYGHEWQYDYVDLGLPSGILWATCNVGAFSPEKKGLICAWGETEKKSDYSWSNYKWYGGMITSTTYVMTKYNRDDQIKTLEPEDDAAHVNWGKEWRMPTSSELDELLNNCVWTRVQVNNVPGYRVTGNNNSSIFFPSTSYWTSSKGFGDSTIYGRGMHLETNKVVIDDYLRCSGYMIRPVEYLN